MNKIHDIGNVVSFILFTILPDFSLISVVVYVILYKNTRIHLKILYLYNSDEQSYKSSLLIHRVAADNVLQDVFLSGFQAHRIFLLICHFWPDTQRPHTACLYVCKQDIPIILMHVFICCVWCNFDNAIACGDWLRCRIHGAQFTKR